MAEAGPDQRVDLHSFVNHFADALASIDRTGAVWKSFKPGIGPFGEAVAVRKALECLKEEYPALYRDAKTKRTPDLLVPGAWAFEMKIIRPFGDNGNPAEHWSENVLHPYAGSTSSIGDCLKLLALDLPVRKAILVFGYEHSPAQVRLDTAMAAFEQIATGVVGLRLGPATHAMRAGLLHPVHQVLRVFAFEVLGTTPVSEAV